MAKRITVNQLELAKMQNEQEKTVISKLGILVDIIESVVPSETKYGEGTNYEPALDQIDRGIVKTKLLELVKKL